MEENEGVRRAADNKGDFIPQGKTLFHSKCASLDIRSRFLSMKNGNRALLQATLPLLAMDGCLK